MAGHGKVPMVQVTPRARRNELEIPARVRKHPKYTGWSFRWSRATDERVEYHTDSFQDQGRGYVLIEDPEPKKTAQDSFVHRREFVLVGRPQQITDDVTAQKVAAVRERNEMFRRESRQSLERLARNAGVSDEDLSVFDLSGRDNPDDASTSR